MATAQAYQAAYDSYKEAIKHLYERPASAPQKAERSEREIYVDHLGEVGEGVLARSEEVREALEANMQTEDLERRELAALKLLATATTDLSVAMDLLSLEESGPAAKPERGAQSAILASGEIRSILDAPMEGGMKGLLKVDRAALPQEPEAARSQLETTVSSFFTDILDDAASLGKLAVGGVADLGLGPAHGAASVAAQEILARVPNTLSFVARRAAGLVIEAIRKLYAAIGPEQQKEVQEKTAKWLEDIQSKEDMVVSLLNKLYETERIKEETKTLIDNAPQEVTAAAFNEATRTLEELTSRYGKTKGVLGGGLRVLAFAKAPLMAAVPWGPLAVYSVYLGVMGYAVYSGGDYLDWYRTGDREWLDRVKGVRSTVRQALSPPTESISANS
jgi:hypothetical protein